MSIFEYINKHLVDDDHLPDDFTLPKLEEKGLPWADGAKDGVFLYHVGEKDIEPDATLRIGAALSQLRPGANEETYKTIDLMLSRLGEEYGALALIDTFQTYIPMHADELDAEAIYEYSIHAITESDDREVVKFGIELQELFQVQEEDVKNLIRLMALSDEFSLFCFYIMKGWENGDTEILEAGRRVHGWGRIHAVQMIEPKTSLIKAWLLKEAVENNVDYNYSAFLCFDKSGAREKLKREITQEEFDGIATIIQSIMAGGPNGGIENLPNSEEVIRDFVKQALTKELDVEDYELIWSMGVVVSDNGRAVDISKNIETIITDPKCKEVMKAAGKEL
ncbi:MAG: hypothetical protein K6F30_11420 [Lachnospiraceae bacterium]|nr:hypothetical protein [Lachnospiraceae bacterium]